MEIRERARERERERETHTHTHRERHDIENIVTILEGGEFV